MSAPNGVGVRARVCAELGRGELVSVNSCSGSGMDSGAAIFFVSGQKSFFKEESTCSSLILLIYGKVLGMRMRPYPKQYSDPTSA